MKIWSQELGGTLYLANEETLEVRVLEKKNGGKKKKVYTSESQVVYEVPRNCLNQAVPWRLSVFQAKSLQVLIIFILPFTFYPNV